MKISPSPLERMTGEMGLATRLDAAVDSFVAEWRLPGISAGIVRNQELLWCGSAGLADQVSGRPTDEHTLFEIASISKTFTATAVLQLRDEGLLDLDDPLVRHVPEFAEATNPFGPLEAVKIRHLLRHTSGLQGEVPPGEDLSVETYLTREELLRAVGRIRVVIPPGTAYKYANLGYRLLGEVVRRLTGVRLHERIRREILDVLGMTSTVDRPAGELAERQAVGYNPRRYEDRLELAPPIDASWCEGDGDLWSSVYDLGRWISQQFRIAEELPRGPNQVLRGSTLAEMQMPEVVVDAQLSAARGLVWFAWKEGEELTLGHDGSMYGFSSHLAFRPASRLGVIVLVNGVCADHVRLGARLLDIAAPSSPLGPHGREPGAIDIVPTPPAWKELVGSYVWADFALELRIEARDGRLVCIQDDPRESPDVLRPTDDPTTFLSTQGRSAGEELKFFRDEQGRISGVNFAGAPATRVRLASDR